MRGVRVLFTATLLADAFACAPAWRDDPALVTRPRIIAIEMEPPEAAPGAAVTFTAVVATPDGPAALPLAWSFCRAPKPLAENGAVDEACLAAEPASLVPAPTLTAAIPRDACRLFGPESPPRSGIGPPPRPRDPDATGGYYQPLVVTGPGKAAVASVRITCNLAIAPLELALELGRRYQLNRNPRLDSITATVDGRPAALEAIAPGRPVELVARWSRETAEAYVAFDPATQTLAERRESIRVSWLVTSGTVEPSHVGRSERDPETSATTIWQPGVALATGARVHVWAVVRDSRGGVSATHREIVLGPPAAVADAALD